LHIRTLQRKGYKVKSSAVGHWVDGNCGYRVAGYFSTQTEAVAVAGSRIAETEKNGRRPAWLILW
jgi:hypothetical protein